MINYDFTKNRKDYFENEDYLSQETGYPERNLDWFNSVILPHFLHTIKKYNCTTNNFIDIGCAYGYFTNIFSKYSNHTLGIDFCTKRINHAKKSKSDVLDFIEIDLLDLDLDRKINKKFDIAFTNAVIQHIPTSKQSIAFENIAKILNDGAYFFVYDAIDHITTDNYFVSRPTLQWYSTLKDYDLVSYEKLQNDHEMWLILLKKKK